MSSESAAERTLSLQGWIGKHLRLEAYWGERQDTSFWIENASVKWREEKTPFHTIARLTLLSKSCFAAKAAEATYFDVTENSTPDSKLWGALTAPAGTAKLPVEKRGCAGPEAVRTLASFALPTVRIESAAVMAALASKT